MKARQRDRTDDRRDPQRLGRPGQLGQQHQPDDRRGGRQQREECIHGRRIGHVFGLFHNGNMPDWKTRHSSKPFAEKVMPAF